MSQELAQLRNKRASTKAAITRIKTFIENRSDLLPEELECRLGLLEAYFKQFLSIQDAIVSQDTTDAETKALGDMEDIYCSIKAKILGTVEESKRRLSMTTTAVTTQQGPQYVTSDTTHLPKLQLPQFSGKYTEYTNFMNTFKVAVDSQRSLSNIEKFLHLRACLSGEALKAVQALEINSTNYTEALNLLETRYNNKYLVFQSHISQLLEVAPANKSSGTQLRRVLDTVNVHLKALEAIGSNEDILNSLLFRIVKSKIDAVSVIKWEESINHKTIPSWDTMNEFLQRRCQFLGTQEIISSPKAPSSQSRTSLIINKSSCDICKAQDHLIGKCSQFLALSVLNRFQRAKDLNLCINCLHRGHTVKNCRATKCRICRKSHHTSLHRFSTHGDTNRLAANSPTTSNTPAISETPIIPTSTSLLSSTNDHVILATASILVKDKYGNLIPARALLDSASQLNFITESLVKKLNINRKLITGEVSGIGDVNSTVLYATQVTIQSRNDNNYHTNIEAWILPKITGCQPDVDINISTWQIPANIPLADPTFYKSQRVDLLLGADEFYKLLAVGQIRLRNDLPVIQKTLLGWIVAGRLQDKFSQTIHCHVARNHDIEPLSDLSSEIERFWSIEEIHSHNIKWTQEQQECEKHFLKTWAQISDGRFILELPFKANRTLLGDSYSCAQASLLRLERRLSRNPELRKMYSEFLQEYENLGHMQRCNSDISTIQYFIPHHCVLRPDSSTTKLRVVFNASCSSSSGTSLNETLMVGPTVQEDLFGIAVRFRCHQYAITADITKMYRQILIVPDHRLYLAILWRNNPSEEIHTYLLNTVTYGTASAPYQATRCLTLLAEQHSKEFPRGSQALNHNMYVDDLLTGADNLEDLLTLKQEIVSLLRLGKFELRKWSSNNQDFLATIPREDQAALLEIKESNFIKALGMNWNPAHDTFQFSQPFKASSKRITKRKMLAQIASLYDPLGLINPLIVTAKILMQELWKLNLNWDESLPQDIHHRWFTFCSELTELEAIKIPRCLYIPQSYHQQLHGFADASTKAYGCCVYLRSEDALGNVEVKLIAAKSRVAPLKSLSIPRLELCASLLLSLLISKLQKIWSNTSIILWTDSEIVLHWIAAQPCTWTTFVANRVSHIQELTSGCQWQHVNSTDNPADIISRGASPAYLLSSIWFSGPHFLQKPSENWPSWNRSEVPETLPEKRKVKTALISQSSSNFDLSRDHKYVNNFGKLRRIFAYVIRFIHRVKRNTRFNSTINNTTDGNSGQEFSSQLSVIELHRSLLGIIYNIQQVEFGKEISALQRQQHVSSNSPLKSLNPFIDKGQPPILRVGGRLRNSNLPYEVKHPAVLPRSHPFVTSYLTFLHRQLMHAGPQALIAAARESVWILNSKKIATRIVNQCIHCFHYRPKLHKQIMGQLPANRTQVLRPFHTVGVDFCGPFLTTNRIRGNRLTKSYIALFICFSSKAVHLEVVSELSADAFIAALRRFISRRGVCTTIYCDNATNLIGANNKLKELHDCLLSQQTKQQLSDTFSEQGIEFRFIPPRAPHFGGLWEAAVKSAKYHLYRILHNSHLTFEELSTVSCEIEAILNSRPISAMSSDPSDERALTPGHFLIGTSLKSIPEPNLINENMSNLRRWRLLSALKQHFWSRWSREYVPQLQQHYKWTTSSPDLKPNTLVLISDKQQPPQKWLLGRIIKIMKGSDGHVRVVEVKTKDGVKLRAVHTLAPLPVDDIC